MLKPERMDEEIKALLAGLKSTPERSAEKAAIGRAAFVRQAEEIKKGVTAATVSRHIGWKRFFKENSRRKETPKMATAFLNILLAITLVLGGGGFAAVSAQSTMPDDALYPVKTLTEGVQETFTFNAEAKFQLALKLTEKRFEELKKMLELKSPAMIKAENRYMGQVAKAYGSLEQVPAAKQAGAQAQLQTRLQTQLQALEALQQKLGGDPVLLRSREMLQERLRIEDSLGPLGPNSPEATPGQGGGFQYQNGQSSETPEPQQEQYQYQYQGGDAQQTPGAGNGYGPGDGICEGCDGTPVEKTPQPGAGYGPGDGTGGGTCSADCTATPKAYDNNYNYQTPQPGGSGSGNGPGKP